MASHPLDAVNAGLTVEPFAHRALPDGLCVAMLGTRRRAIGQKARVIGLRDRQWRDRDLHFLRRVRDFDDKFGLSELQDLARAEHALLHRLAIQKSAIGRIQVAEVNRLAFQHYFTVPTRDRRMINLDMVGPTPADVIDPGFKLDGIRRELGYVDDEPRHSELRMFRAYGEENSLSTSNAPSAPSSSA